LICTKPDRDFCPHLADESPPSGRTRLIEINAWTPKGAPMFSTRINEEEDSMLGPPSQEQGDWGALARYCYDASLLFQRMAGLRIDSEELATDDPLLFRELQGLCTLCRSIAQCVRDLAHEGDAASGQDWHEYCLNAATLNAFGAVEIPCCAPTPSR
jgi:hypothetical protein